MNPWTLDVNRRLFKLVQPHWGHGACAVGVLWDLDTSRDDYVSIMSDHLPPFMTIVHSDKVGQFQKDNVIPHISRVATVWLQEHSSDFRHFHCPHKSLDRNTIEHIWDDLQRAVRKRSPPPRTSMYLCTILQDSWRELPLGFLQTIMDSMPRRVAALLHALGGPTRY